MSKRRKRRGSVLRKALAWALRAGALLLVADLLYVAWIWPDWARLARGPVPRSNFIKVYQERRPAHHWPRLRWDPVPLSRIPRAVQRAVILGEDSRFYSHSGFDLIAIREALDYDLSEGRLALGASTISQQTVKNLFLTPDRSLLRKWHELILTWGLEHHLSKQRILEIYLNTAEFGRGIYGVQAAAEAYWGVPVSALSIEQAAELAASLPSPRKNNPAHRTNYFLSRTNKVLALLEHELPPSEDYPRAPQQDDGRAVHPQAT